MSFYIPLSVLYNSLFLYCTTHLIKIRNDLIKQPQTLHALVVPVQLHIELVVVGYGGEHDARALVRLVV